VAAAWLLLRDPKMMIPPLIVWPQGRRIDGTQIKDVEPGNIKQINLLGRDANFN
jgi:hypothetical protein